MSFFYLAEGGSAKPCKNVFRVVRCSTYNTLFYMDTCLKMSIMPYKVIKFNQNFYGRVDGRKYLITLHGKVGTRTGGT